MTGRVTGRQSISTHRNNRDYEEMDNPPICHRREMGAKFEDDSMNCCIKDVVHKTPTLFMFFHFYEA